jgi:hypothetical protein
MARKKKTEAASAAKVKAKSEPATKKAEPKVDVVGAKADAFIAKVIGVANVGGEKDGYTVLSLRCPQKPEAGMLKVVGEAQEGDTVEVWIVKK